MLYNCNAINSANNINEIKQTNNIDEEDKSIRHDLAWTIFVNNLLMDDCLTNFQKHYRLQAHDFDFITYKNVVKAFELFLHEKYDIKFKIKIKEGKYEYISSDKLNKIEIDVCLYKEKWKVINTNLIVNIETNDSLDLLQYYNNKWTLQIIKIC